MTLPLGIENRLYESILQTTAPIWQNASSFPNNEGYE